MNALCVLFVIDTDGALASGSLSDNCYVLDTNGYVGSWTEGSGELHTVCEDGPEIIWSAAPVSSGAQAVIAGFAGAMLDEQVCVPASMPGAGGAWSAVVEARGVFASYTYTATVAMHTTELQVQCAIKVA